MLPHIGFGTYKIFDQTVFENAIKNGYIAFDTAELYKNEQLVKNAIDICSDKKKIYVTSKISKKSILSGKIKESFYERIAIFGYVDLILLHCPTNDCRRDWEILSDIYEKNRDKVGFIGVSNYDIRHMEQIKECKIKPYCNQIELSPFYTRFELVKYLRDASITIVSHTTLTRAEKFDNEKLIEISKKYNTSVANIMLMWAVYYNYIIIPRTKEVDHMIENKVYKCILSKDDIEILNSLNENYCITKIAV